MDIETLLKELRRAERYCLNDYSRMAGDAVIALSTLQAENEKLRDEVESLKKGHCAGCSVPVVEAERLRDLNEAPNLWAELEQVKRERDAAIEYLREIEWCAGCKNFGGLDGCKKWVIGQCTEKHDLYEFIGPQKED